MPRKSRTDRIKTLEEQQKEIQKKMKDIERKMYEDIGKYFSKQLEIDDEQKAYSFIDKLKESNVGDSNKVTSNE